MTASSTPSAPSPSPFKYDGSCSCGRVHVGLTHEPMLQYNCHCSHCRAFAGNDKPYHTGAMVWRWSAIVDVVEHKQKNDDNDSSNAIIDYSYTTSLGGLFGLARGRCRYCQDCVIEMGTRLASPYAMVMAPPLKGIQPNTDIFYNSGIIVHQQQPKEKQQSRSAINESNKILYTDLDSWLFEIWIVLTVGLATIPSSLFSRIRYAWTSNNDTKVSKTD